MNWWALKREDGEFYAGIADRKPVFGPLPAHFSLIADAKWRQDQLEKAGIKTEIVVPADG